MRLIDADAIPWDVEGVGEIPVITKEEIDQMPESVIRCEDCKNYYEWENGTGSCNRSNNGYNWFGVDSTDFCSFAERKMTRLIDADALDMYESLKSYYGDAWRDAQKEIDNAPTVDAVPVRHGQWLSREEGCVYPFWERYTCSVCGKHADNTEYCPNCGARMDENDEVD